MDKCWQCPMLEKKVAEMCIDHPDDCHLTPSDMTAIKGAIAGEGRLCLDNTLLLIGLDEFGKPKELGRIENIGQDQGGE